MIAKILLWIVILGGVSAGGYAVVKNKQTVDTAPKAEETTKPQEKKMAFSAFLKADAGAYKCTVHQLVGDMESSGTVYIESGKLRGEFTTIAEGRTMTTSILSKDGYQYMWSPQMTTGMKMAVQSSAEGSADAQASGVYSWDADQIGDYDCAPWKADSATFSLPSGMVFTDLSAMMKLQ